MKVLYHLSVCVLSLLFFSCAVQSVNYHYNAVEKGRGSWGIGIEGGVGREISQGYPSDGGELEWKDFLSPLAEIYAHYYAQSNLQILLSIASSFPVPTGINVNAGLNYTYLRNSPLFASLGSEFTFVKGKRSYTLNLFGTSTEVDNRYLSFGMRIPILFSFSPVRWFTLTGGIPLYFNYFIFDYSSGLEGEEKFDFSPSLYFSLELILWKIRLMPQVSLLYMRNPSSKKYIFSLFPSFGLGLEFF